MVACYSITRVASLPYSGEATSKIEVMHFDVASLPYGGEATSRIGVATIECGLATLWWRGYVDTWGAAIFSSGQFVVRNVKLL